MSLNVKSLFKLSGNVGLMSGPKTDIFLSLFRRPSPNDDKRPKLVFIKYISENACHIFYHLFKAQVNGVFCLNRVRGYISSIINWLIFKYIIVR